MSEEHYTKAGLFIVPINSDGFSRSFIFPHLEIETQTSEKSVVNEAEPSLHAQLAKFRSKFELSAGRESVTLSPVQFYPAVGPVLPLHLSPAVTAGCFPASR